MSRRFGFTVALGAFLATGCTGGGDGPGQVGPGTSATNGTQTTTTTTGTTDTDTGTGTGTGGTTGGPGTCADLLCTGHGTCEMGAEGPYCMCDPGYIVDPDEPTACIVDESCIELRFLDDSCRQLLNSTPAVSLFFAVDFCAGTAVLPDKLAELGLEFQVLENGADIAENVESYATVVETGVESYVSLVVDVSDSITDSGDFPALITELRSMVAGLKPAAGEPDVYVNVIAFGRRVQEYVPFTKDLDGVDQALAALASDPAASLAHYLYGDWNGMGTELFDAVITGIERTDRMRGHRSAVTDGGVLTTGTVVVVTDGKDSSNATLDTNAINQTINQVVSIGISPEVDNQELQDIGRDGSFLAPTPADWKPAFDEITQRVDEYPDRSYLLGYCSSTTTGSPEVEVVLQGVQVKNSAICKFNADLFAANPPKCTADFFATECDQKACGGLTACGACGDDQCCAGASCMAPGDLVACNGLDDLCAVSGQVCNPTGDVNNPWVCGPASNVGEDCSSGNPKCRPGQAWCDTTMDPDTCVATSGDGQSCEKAAECDTLHCAQTNPKNPLDPKICQPPAQAFDACSGEAAVCETGTYCSGDCTLRKPNGAQCGQADECRSGVCAGMTTKFCVGSGTCQISWNQKLQ